jgi:hypothetical protein
MMCTLVNRLCQRVVVTDAVYEQTRSRRRAASPTASPQVTAAPETGRAIVEILEPALFRPLHAAPSTIEKLSTQGVSEKDN